MRVDLQARVTVGALAEDDGRACRSKHHGLGVVRRASVRTGVAIRHHRIAEDEDVRAQRQIKPAACLQLLVQIGFRNLPVDAAISPRASSSQVPKPDVEQTTQSRGTSVMAGSTSELGRGTHSQDGHVATAAVVVADVANLKPPSPPAPMLFPQPKNERWSGGK